MNNKKYLVQHLYNTHTFGHGTEEYKKPTIGMSQEIMEPEAFFPVAKNPTTVRTAQLAVLELLKQPEGSDESQLIKMFGRIHHQFKESFCQSISHVPVSLIEREE